MAVTIHVPIQDFYQIALTFLAGIAVHIGELIRCEEKVVENSMKQIKQLKDVDIGWCVEFEYDFKKFTLSYNCKKFFARAFGVEVLAAYINGGCGTDGKVLNLGCTDIVLFLKSGRILRLFNSEWGDLEIVK